MEHSPRTGLRKRPYRSRMRQRQSEETRRRLLTVARELLASKGYANMTLEMIAEAAEVSPKTISAVFGSKRGLLAELINPTTFGDAFQKTLSQLRATPEPSKRLALVAQLMRHAYEPFVPEFELLRTAPAVASELADLARKIEVRRHQNQSLLITYLDEHHLLRRGLSLEVAADVLWGLTSYDLYRALVVEYHWPPERYEGWLTQLLIQQLLQPSEG